MRHWQASYVPKSGLSKHPNGLWNIGGNGGKMGGNGGKWGHNRGRTGKNVVCQEKNGGKQRENAQGVQLAQLLRFPFLPFSRRGPT